MKRALGWVKKYLVEKYDEIVLEVKIKKNKIDGCDNVHHVRKSVEDKFLISNPIFYISTGRTGTKFVAELMRLCPTVKAYHEPEPTLMAVSTELYESRLSPEMQKLIFKSVRYEKMLKNYLAGLRYVESNQTLISLVDGILLTFPKAKIVFLVRHPYSFAQSAFKKGWFANDTIWENNRIGCQYVNSLGQLQTIFQNWLTVSKVILEKNKEYKQCSIFKLEDLTTDVGKAEDLLKFIEVGNVSLKTLAKKLSIKVNENKAFKWEHDGIKKSENDADLEDFKRKNEKFILKEIFPVATQLKYEL
jgi:hypothetical protein